MNLKYSIRNLYTPVQPAATRSDGDISYVELLPDPMLQDYIYCYWSLQTTKPLDNAYRYRVVSDGCIDVFFELDCLENMYIMGFCNSFVEFDMGKRFNYWGIRFLPGMFSALFHIDASELSNRSEQLALVQSHLYNYIFQLLDGCIELCDFSKQLNTYFFNCVNNTNHLFDQRFSKAITAILHHKGLIHVEKDLGDGISSRHLRRLFHFYVGDSVKSFCRVIRFQNLLKIDPSIYSIPMNKAFYDFGYYDQTHFIKEFKQFYGVTPSKVLV